MVDNSIDAGKALVSGLPQDPPVEEVNVKALKAFAESMLAQRNSWRAQAHESEEKYQLTRRTLIDIIENTKLSQIFWKRWLLRDVEKVLARIRP